MPNHRSLALLVAACVLTMATAAGAAGAAEPTAAKPAAAQPGAGGRQPAAKFAAKTATCREYLALPPNLRGLVVAWTAGRYYQSKSADAWILDEGSANKVLTTVDEQCVTAPEASFRYKVVSAVKKR